MSKICPNCHKEAKSIQKYTLRTWVECEHCKDNSPRLIALLEEARIVIDKYCYTETVDTNDYLVPHDAYIALLLNRIKIAIKELK